MPDVIVLRRAPPPAAPPLAAASNLEFAPAAARFILRGGANIVTRASDAFGVALPMVPRCAAQSGGRAAIWLGPDEWLVIAEAEDASAVATDLSLALQSEVHSLVDVSHRQVGLSLSGRSTVRVLSAGCPLDLHPDTFPAGMATRTLFAKAEIVLWRQADQRFRIEVGRSFADYVIALVCDAARGAPNF